MTLSIPKELHARMKGLSEIRWSQVARKAIEERINDSEEMERIASKSKLTQKDATKLAKKINRAMAKKLYGAHN